MKAIFSAVVTPVILSVALTTSSFAFAKDQMPAGHQMGENKSMGMAGHSMGSMELQKQMDQQHKMMMSKPMTMSGNVDKDFAAMMIMHHQHALKMCDTIIKNGTNAELKAMAMKMKTAQQAEIKQLTAYTK